MTELFGHYTKHFEPISLKDMNARAALLDRQENKYVLTIEQFQSMIGEFADTFDILTIDDRTVFNYRTVYFDTEELIGYTYHNQGRNKRRFKIRTRYYTESGLCFFEVKLKDKRGGTIKKRMKYAAEYGAITEQAMKFMHTTYEQVYAEPFQHQLSAIMEINYNRITLVAKDSSERMTIDFDLWFTNGKHRTLIRPFIIIETKSPTGRGIADAIFKQHNIRPRSCSKYILGANLLRLKVKYNRFKPLLKLYHSLPIYHTGASAMIPGTVQQHTSREVRSESSHVLHS